MLGFCGNLSFINNSINGQTIKTKNVLDELSLYFDDINVVDTDSIYRKPIRGMMKLFYTIKHSDKMIILPAYRALIIMVFLLFFLNKERQTYYIVIGGWLPKYLKKYNWLKRRVSNYAGLYVETKSMQEELIALGLNNVYYMPNFKPMPIRNEDAIQYTDEVFRFCTFSRISKEKGIELAIDAIKYVRSHYNKNVELDIYGVPDPNYKLLFDSLCKTFPDYISYEGAVSTQDATYILSKYYALLFPTFYHGEGFPGTVIDSFSAGLPVLASRWHYNEEIIDLNRTGYFFDANNLDSLIEAILYSINNKHLFEIMRKSCFEEATKYAPENVMHEFITHLMKSGEEK